MAFRGRECESRRSSAGRRGRGISEVSGFKDGEVMDFGRSKRILEQALQKCAAVPRRARI